MRRRHLPKRKTCAICGSEVDYQATTCGNCGNAV